MSDRLVYPKHVIDVNSICFVNMIRMAFVF